MKLRAFFCFFIVLPLALIAKRGGGATASYDPSLNPPWLTGPLLTPGPTVLPFPHVNIETYAKAVVNHGQYGDDWKAVPNSHHFYSNNVQTNLQFGLTSWMDFQVSPQVYYNYVKNSGYWVLGDLPVTVDIQLYNPDSSSWWPSFKLILQESFPTGKYRKLNPHKHGADGGGSGSYTTTFGLAIGKVAHVKADHFFSWRLAGQYSFPAPVRLLGFNVYGGNRTTDMNFVPAQSAQGSFGVEYTISQNWVFALDGVFVWAKSANYSGSPGTGLLFNPQPIVPVPGTGGDAIFILIETPATKVSTVVNPAMQYSLAPAIEYNWSANLGLIVGSWFTLGGKNTVQFYSGMAALNWSH